MFLRLRGDDQFSPVSFVNPVTEFSDFSIPVARLLDPDYSYRSEDPLIHEVLSELANSAEALPNEPGLEFIHHGGLDRLSSSALQPDRRVLGLAGLVRSGESSVLARLEAQIPMLAGSGNFGLLRFSIAAYYRSCDPSEIAVLGRLATGAIPAGGLTSAAAQALAAIHCRQALPYLAQLLDSVDPELVAFGVGGLGLFANQGEGTVSEHIQVTGRENAPFRTEETMEHFTMDKDVLAKARDRYVLFWKKWWAENQQKIGH